MKIKNSVININQEDYNKWKKSDLKKETSLEDANAVINRFFKDTSFTKFSKYSHKNPLKHTIHKLMHNGEPGFYIITSVLGKGVYGRVKKAINLQTKKEYALKSLKYCENGRNNLISIEKEEKCLSKQGFLKSSKTIPFFERKASVHLLSVDKKLDYKRKYAKEDENVNKRYMLMDIADSNFHNFYKYTKLNLKDKLLACFFITEAMEKLHKNGVLHLDIKPDNIGVNFDKNNNISKIWFFDYGISCLLDKNKEYAVRVPFAKRDDTYGGYCSLYHPKEFVSQISIQKAKQLFEQNKLSLEEYKKLALYEHLKNNSSNTFGSLVSKKTDVYILAHLFGYMFQGEYKAEKELCYENGKQCYKKKKQLRNFAEGLKDSSGSLEQKMGFLILDMIQAKQEDRISVNDVKIRLEKIIKELDNVSSYYFNESDISKRFSELDSFDFYSNLYFKGIFNNNSNNNNYVTSESNEKKVYAYFNGDSKNYNSLENGKAYVKYK